MRTRLTAKPGIKMLPFGMIVWVKNDFVEVLIWPSTQRLLNLQAGEHVHDIACGNGLYTRRLAAMGVGVTAFDSHKI